MTTRKEGSVRRVARTFVVKLYIGSSGGKRVYWTHTVAGTTRQAEREANAILAQLIERKRGLAGAVLREVRMSLGDWLTEYVNQWCDGVSERTRAE